MEQPSRAELQAFNEARYAPRSEIVTAPRDDDFMYGQVLQVMRQYLEPGMRVLDLGCNTGRLSMYMASHGCMVLGVDIARNAIDVARRSAAHHEVDGVSFEVSDFGDEWESPQTFDLVLCCFVLEHIPDDVRVLTRVRSLLEPEGTLLLFTATPYSLPMLLSRAIPSSRLFVLDSEIGHIHHYSRAGLRSIMSDAGLAMVRTCFLDSPLRDCFVRIKPLRRLLRVLASRYLRRTVNRVDAFLSTFLFPGTIFVEGRPANREDCNHDGLGDVRTHSG